MSSRPAHLVLALAIFAPCALHAAGQTIHRCLGEHGEISFSGAPCGNAGTASTSAPPPRSTADGIAGAARTCPASEDALRDLVADAFARRDANALAGVLRWDGIGGGAARERMRALAELTERPLLGIDISVDNAGDVEPPASSDAMLTVRTGSLAGGAGEHDFRVIAADGCYWLDW